MGESAGYFVFAIASVLVVYWAVTEKEWAWKLSICAFLSAIANFLMEIVERLPVS